VLERLRQSDEMKALREKYDFDLPPPLMALDGVYNLFPAGTMIMPYYAGGQETPELAGDRQFRLDYREALNAALERAQADLKSQFRIDGDPNNFRNVTDPKTGQPLLINFDPVMPAPAKGHAAESWARSCCNS
jgi:hypothetical protein